MDTIQSVIDKLPSPSVLALPTPDYSYRKGGRKLALAVASMKDHMTNEGWQIMAGLGENGYELCGHGLPVNETNVRWLTNELNPSVVLLQDKREWDVKPGDFRDPEARFTNVEYLKNRSDVFKLTILKDAQQRPDYHMQSAEEIGCHAWVVYYDERIVYKLAPYVRPKHLLRTYHTIDPRTVPEYTAQGRDGCLLSGAISGAYPLRSMLFKQVKALPKTTALYHPGYHRHGSATPGFMTVLSKFKVAICTASMYGYALRKLIEATACGCVVITNLPSDEVLPEIDANLVRVQSDFTAQKMAAVVSNCINSYDPDRQKYYARKAVERYDFRVETRRLGEKIERLRADYP